MAGSSPAESLDAVFMALAGVGTGSLAGRRLSIMPRAGAGGSTREIAMRKADLDTETEHDLFEYQMKTESRRRRRGYLTQLL